MCLLKNLASTAMVMAMVMAMATVMAMVMATVMEIEARNATDLITCAHAYIRRNQQNLHINT